MKTTISALFLLVTVAVAQLSAGDAWQGTWSEGKRGVGGNVYICVDPWTQTAHGTYGDIGVFSGYLWGNTMTGFWYEAGYDRPFGPFQLTISGSSFSGTWSYYQNNATHSWSGSRSSNTKPDVTQCLIPGPGRTAAGTFNNNNYICVDEHNTFDNTDQLAVAATFDNFGSVLGYSPDNGKTVLLSDFYLDDDDTVTNDTYRPENNPIKIGGGSGDDGDSEFRHGINTRRIVVGRLINDAEFCGFFWKGFYRNQVSTGALCFRRTDTFNVPTDAHCHAEDIRQSSGLTSWILSQIQSAFNNLVLPPVVIIANDPFITKNSPIVETNSRTTISQSNGQTNTRTTISSISSGSSGSSTSGASTILTNSDTTFFTSETTYQASLTNSAASLAVSIFVLAFSVAALI